ncbi:hypothetical protein AB6O49_34490 [Streptomyces sp. SBR177]
MLPKAAARDGRLQFVIAVSPAVNWLRQGRFNLLAELDQAGASEQDRQAALRRRETVLGLLERGATFAQYRAAVGDADGMTAARWGFIARNYRADATADLTAMRGTPLLLVLAGHDTNVDVTDTEATYRRVLPAASLAVTHYPGATHSLVDHDLESSPWRLTMTAIAAPAGCTPTGSSPIRPGSSGRSTPVGQSHDPCDGTGSPPKAGRVTSLGVGESGVSGWCAVLVSASAPFPCSAGRGAADWGPRRDSHASPPSGCCWRSPSRGARSAGGGRSAARCVARCRGCRCRA